MKKALLLVIVALVVSEMANAQHAAGDKNLNIGLGLGNRVITGDQTIPPVSASFEVGIKDNISVGGYLGHTGSKFDIIGTEFKYSYTIIGARGSYHYDFLGNEKIDTYGGLMLGYNLFGGDLSGGDFIWGAHIGGRYAFTDKIGAFAELGNGLAWLQLGANIKF